MSLNKVMLIGRLTRDPEMRYTPSGQPVTSFGLATNRYLSGNDGERREMTDFHDIVAWNIGRRNLAEIVAQYTRRGSLVYVEGRLQTRSWDGPDGKKRYRTEVVAENVQFLESRGGQQQNNPQPQPVGAASSSGGASTGMSEEPAPVQDVDPDQIPF
jgi:single-strand DNA-binding protein